jgi:hypothetical protein
MKNLRKSVKENIFCRTRIFIYEIIHNILCNYCFRDKIGYGRDRKPVALTNQANRRRVGLHIGNEARHV